METEIEEEKEGEEETELKQGGGRNSWSARVARGGVVGGFLEVREMKRNKATGGEKRDAPVSGRGCDATKRE